ncbi:methyl-accepting chemotaxis protein [Marinobacterium jannaschii]|uniref:methyl-accepting chemotaxis protein n=1 Tax=Marinobacterium jannaschii TaxID=64970 RepID=UPI000683F7EF|nr:methyl-accepting chemotaxis protein [Marinobacterium jannaschii]
MTLKHRFLLLLAGVVVAFAALFAIQSWQNSAHQDSWEKLQQQAQARQQLLLEIRQYAGYGALIHNFKNYVLRGTPKYHERVIADFEQVSGLIDRYRDLPQLTTVEKKALRDISDTLLKYRNAADQIQALIAQGFSVRELDKAVKISDGPAIEGFQRLEKHYQEIVQNATAEFEAISRAGFRYMLLATGIALVLIMGVAFWLYQYLTGRLDTLFAALKNLTDGQGDLSQRLQLKGNDEFQRLAQEINSFMANMAKLIADIHGLSQDLELGLDRINNNASGNAARTEQQKNETELLAAAVEEMANTAHSVANNTSDAVKAVDHAQTEFTAGVDSLGSAADGMRHLAEDVRQGAAVITRLKTQSDRIGEIVSVIGDIADQTNLLALNAAIEAARAGDQGRGFAVVADEVRTLAGRTQQSTIEIRKMIEELQLGSENAVRVMASSEEKSGHAVERVQLAERALKEISQEMDHISDLNMQIASASEEQSAVTDEISANIQRIFTLSEETSQAVAENKNAIATLDGRSETLNGLVARFHV